MRFQDESKDKISYKNFRSHSQAGYTLIAKYAKMGAKCEKQKLYSGVLRETFFAFRAPFFAFYISQHFAPGLAFTRNVKGFRFFFCGINKTQNLYEIQKVYSACFILAKCEKCIAGLTRTSNWNSSGLNHQNSAFSVLI